jgi:ankyrin repeat protein
MSVSGEQFLAAVLAGDGASVQRYIRDGGDPDIRDAREWTALMLAAMSGFADIVGVLVAAGADVNAKSRDGSSALLEAVLWRHDAIAEFLLAHGANADAIAANGWTARAVAELRRREVEPGRR